MRSNKMIYGRVAYEGFAKAIGSRLGLRVELADGSHACINAGGVVQIPGMHTYQTADEFAVTCGTVVHELSHQFYGSHKMIDPNRARLEHDCLNAVLDVADETWIARWFERAGNKRPGYLLEKGNEAACYQSALSDWTDPATNAWRVLCVGILNARLPRERSVRRLKRYTVAQARSLGVDAAACLRLIAKARVPKAQDPRPTPTRFAKLLRIASKLAELLKPFTPPDNAPAVGVGTSIGDATSAGSASQPSGTQVAGAQDGAQIANDGNAGAGGFGPSESSGAEFDSDSFSALYPAVQRIAERIAVDGDGIERTAGLPSGSILTQAHRLMTDGDCFARWDLNDHADGVSVSVVLDCSGSMGGVLAECAGIARAFALGMQTAGDVQTLVFGGGVEESAGFDRVRTMGSTNTALAVKKATEFLAARGGQRWIVVITDGDSNDPGETERVCANTVAQGIRILSIGLGTEVQTPHATCVTAQDSTHLAIELDAAGRMIERQ